MKYFSDFLIHKKITSSDKIVESYLKQISALPPLAQLTYENKLLTADEILIIFNAQQDLGCDFITACKHKNYWNQEIQNQIEEKTNQIRKPMGEYLLESGAVEIKTLVKALDEFLSQAQSPTHVPVSELAPASTQANHFNYSPSINELTEFFNASKFEEFENLLQLVKQNITVKEIASEFLQDILKNLQTLKGFARFGKLTEFESIITVGIDSLSLFLRSHQFSNEQNGLKYLTYLNEILNFIFAFKEAISIDKTEIPFLDQEKNKISFQKLRTSNSEFTKLLQGVA